MKTKNLMLTNVFIYFLFMTASGYSNSDPLNLSLSPTPDSRKHIFIMNITSGKITDKDLSGIPAADSLCQKGISTLQGVKIQGPVKALIVDGVNRVACTSPNCSAKSEQEHRDWVLAPNTKYVWADSVEDEFGTTDQLGLFDRVSIPIGYNYAWKIYTGLQTSWVTGETCNQWTSDSNKSTASIGNLKQPSTLFFSMLKTSCVSKKFVVPHLLCVEQ